MNWRSVVLTTTAIAASCWWFWPDSMVTADATGPLPLAEKQEVIAPAGKTLAFSDQPVTSSTVKTQCQLPDINVFEERRAPLRQQLQLYLQQQLQDAVP